MYFNSPQGTVELKAWISESEKPGLEYLLLDKFPNLLLPSFTCL